MEGYAEYQQLLSNNIAEGEANFQKAKETFESGLARANEVKQLIDRTTEVVGAPFLLTPLEKGFKGAVRAGVEKITGKKIRTPSDEKGQTEPTDDVEPTDVEETPTEFERTDFQPYGEEPEPTPQPAQQSIADAGTEGEQPYQLSGDAPAGSGEPAPLGEEPIETGGLEETAFGGEGAVTTDVPAVAADIGEGITDLALDLDPFTAIFGLIFGAVTIGAGIAGSDDVKTPTAPQIKIPQASTQFGF